MNEQDAPHFNLYELMRAQADRHPGRLAFALARQRHRQSRRYQYETRTYAQLLAEVDRTAAGLHESGIRQGTKTLLLMRPDLALPVTVFALFKLGAVPVFINPAMSLRHMLGCIRQVAPQALIAPTLVHALRPLLSLVGGRALSSVTLFINSHDTRLPATRRLADLSAAARTMNEMAQTHSTDLAAIFFTSGSTGPAKGVEATHGTLGAQIAHFRSMSQSSEEHVELAAFPVALLTSPCLGQTSVVPDMGSLHPGRCQPANLIQAIEDFGVTSGFASPVVWERLSRFCVARGLQLPSLKRAFSGGAPIPYKMLDRIGNLMPNGVMHTPYGTTEVTPITTIDAREIEQETALLSRDGRGVCVGRVVPGLTVKIIRLDDQPLAHWDDVQELQTGEIGEVVVRGALVSPRYHQDPINTARNKIAADTGDARFPFWHRTGDAGYFDKHGRLWLCGRIQHMVEVVGQRYCSVPVEEVLNAEDEIWRSALVGVIVKGSTELAVVIEFYPEYKHQISQTRLKTYKARLHELGFPVTHLLPYPRPFPVDKLHNAKIERHVLARWAQAQINKGVRT